MFMFFYLFMSGFTEYLSDFYQYSRQTNLRINNLSLDNFDYVLKIHFLKAEINEFLNF